MSVWQWTTLALAGFSVGVAMWLAISWNRRSRRQEGKERLKKEVGRRARRD